ncbi:hypothetical protein KAS08_02390 [Candidatus Pacearchaeota archaeon]|nr:hypothetical protein [Candidatus Pacearchaeota archaeon]
MVNKTALTIIVSIILTVIMISLVNVGTSIVLTEPEHSDYCDESEMIWKENMTDSEREAQRVASNECSDAYQEARKPYNQYRYYIFAGIGFVLLLVGLFFKENIIQLTGLAAGGILVAEGIVINLENKGIVFFSLLAILAVFGVVAYRVIHRHEEPKKVSKKK